MKKGMLNLRLQSTPEMVTSAATIS